MVSNIEIIFARNPAQPIIMRTAGVCTTAFIVVLAQ